MSLVLEYVPAPTDEVRLLIGELDVELNGVRAEQRHGLNIDAIFQPNIAFLIADGRPAGWVWWDRI